MSAMLHVLSETQRVELRDANGSVLWSAACSTSQYGLGETPGSEKTPRGRHYIRNKIGAGVPLNGIFRSRVFTGDIWDGKPHVEDLILTRILRLAGAEPSNVSTFDRMIYFHGTNHEDALGSPASHGCIRLRNADVLALFDRIDEGTLVIVS